jgi:hypothetical protein
MVCRRTRCDRDQGKKRKGRYKNPEAVKRGRETPNSALTREEQKMGKPAAHRTRVTLAFGSLISLLCHEALHVTHREQEAFRLIHRMLPGFLAAYAGYRREA